MRAAVAEHTEARVDAEGSQTRASCVSGTVQVDKRLGVDLGPSHDCVLTSHFAFPSVCVILTVLWVGVLRNRFVLLMRPSQFVQCTAAGNSC